ncbi:MAG: response regulator [Burkholderiaceae bacterium]
MSNSQQAIRILVVDDSADAANGLVAVLNLADYEARAAYDGFSALKLAASFRPHLVLLDIEMPGMNGYATAHELRRRAPKDSQVLVAYTANSDSPSVAAAARAGFDLHVGKPCEIRDLLPLLERAVSRLKHKTASESLQSRRHATG